MAPAAGGGEAEALTDWKPGLADFAALPDGRAVAFLATDPPREEDERRERERDDARVFGERWPYARPRLLDLETRAIRTLDGLGDRHAAELAPSPDGTRLAVFTWPTPEFDHWTRPHEIHLVDPASGAATLLCTVESGGHSLVWGGDGRRLFFLARAEPGDVGGQAIFTVDLAERTPRALATDLPSCPMALCREPAAAPLVAVAEGLDSTIRRLDPATGDLAAVSRWRGDLGGLSAGADGRAVAIVASTPDEPANIWAGPPEGPLRRLSDLRPELREIAWGRQERLAWTARDGLALDGLLILPPGKGRADGPFPLITLVHGGPYGRVADSFQLGWHPSGQWLATAGYAVFLPNPRGGMGHGRDFAVAGAGAVGLDDWGDILAGLDLLIARGSPTPAAWGSAAGARAAS